MEHTAFALRDEYAGTVEIVPEKGAEPVEVDAFQGGVLAVPPDARSFNVAQRLADGDGLIVVSTANTPLVELLRGYPPLKEVPAPEGAVPVGYDDQTVAMLRDELERRDLPRGGSKAELVARLEENDAAREAGDQEAADTAGQDDDGQGD